MPEFPIEEWMDAPNVSAADMRRTLKDLHRINRLFGGVGPTFRTLWPMLTRVRTRPVRVLDVGAGDGQILRLLVDRCRRAGAAVEAVGVDIHPVVLEVGRAECAGYKEIEFLPGDALALPFEDATFDFALSTLALHHLSPEKAGVALQEMRRVTRHGLVVNDLRRSTLAYWTTRLTLPLLGCQKITCHDGPVSVLRSFTRADFLNLIKMSGIPGLKYRQCAFFRVVISEDRREPE